MISRETELITELSKILPTYFELICNSNTPKPCITYIEYNNYNDAVGDTIAFSRIQYMIKIWDTSEKNIQTYADEVDMAMLKLGYRRESTNVLVVGRNIEKIMVYSILDSEDID